MNRGQIQQIDENARKLHIWINNPRTPERRRWLFHVVRHLTEKMYSNWQRLDEEQQNDRLIDLFTRIFAVFQSSLLRVTARKNEEKALKDEVNWALTKGDMAESVVYIAARELYYLLKQLKRLDWEYDGRPELILTKPVLEILKDVPKSIDLGDYNDDIDETSSMDAFRYEPRDWLHKIRRRRPGGRHNPIVIGGTSVFRKKWMKPYYRRWLNEWGNESFNNRMMMWDSEFYKLSPADRETMINNFQTLFLNTHFPSFYKFATWINDLPYPTQIDYNKLLQAVPKRYLVKPKPPLYPKDFADYVESIVLPKNVLEIVRENNFSISRSHLLRLTQRIKDDIYFILGVTTSPRTVRAKDDLMIYRSVIEKEDYDEKQFPDTIRDLMITLVLDYLS